MPELRHLCATLVVLTFALAACGSGTTGSASSSPDAGAPSGAAPTATPASSADASPGEPAPSAAPSTGGGSVGSVCELVTPAELDGIFGASGIATEVIAGPPDTCDVQLDGAPIAAFVLTPSGGRMVFDLLAAGEGVQDIPGIGDAAIFEPSSQLVVVAVGDAMLSVAVYAEGLTEAEAQELRVGIAEVAAGRM